MLGGRTNQTRLRANKTIVAGQSLMISRASQKHPGTVYDAFTEKCSLRTHFWVVLQGVVTMVSNSPFQNCARGLGIATYAMHHGTVLGDGFFVCVP